MNATTTKAACATCGTRRGDTDHGDAKNLCRKCANRAWIAQYEAGKMADADAYAAQPVGVEFELPMRGMSKRIGLRAEIEAFGAPKRIVHLYRFAHDQRPDVWRGGRVLNIFPKSNTGIKHGHEGWWIVRHGQFTACRNTILNRNSSVPVAWAD